MERETKKLQTPLGKEVEIKTYLTKGEVLKLRDIYLKGMKVETGDDGKPFVKEVSGSVVTEAENKLIELAAVSYDGSKEQILERLLNERVEEYDFILAEATKLQSDFLQAK